MERRLVLERRRTTIWPYLAGDHHDLLVMAERSAIGIPAWRSVTRMRDAARQWVETSIAKIGPEQAVFVAERAAVIVGFASVGRETAFTGEEQAYIGELAVAADTEGQGIGQALLTASEGWAREQKLPRLVLETGAPNTRGRRFYSLAGFQEESVRLTKIVDRAAQDEHPTIDRLKQSAP